MNWKALAIVSVTGLAFGPGSGHAQSAQYGYDALGRLTSVTYANGSSVAYAYDVAGNRTLVSSTVPAVAASLSASPATINQGSSSTLTWATANATSASINNGVGSVTPVSGGSVSVSPSTTMTYTLTATGPGGSATAPATVTVMINDYSVDPWSWPNRSIDTAATYESTFSPTQTLTGFNQPVTLRVATPSASGNVSAAGLYAFKNGVIVGSYEFMGNPNGYVDVPVQPNDNLMVFTDAQTWIGRVTGAATITVRNLSDNNALLTSYSLSMALGPDYSVTPWSWPDQSINTNTNYGSFFTPVQTLTGFNQTVTLRVKGTAHSGGVNAAGLYVIKNGATAGSYNFIEKPQDDVEVTVQAGDTLHLMVDAVQWTGPTTGSATISVRNASDGDALLSSFNLSIVIGQ